MIPELNIMIFHVSESGVGWRWEEDNDENGCIIWVGDFMCVFVFSSDSDSFVFSMMMISKRKSESYLLKV